MNYLICLTRFQCLEMGVFMELSWCVFGVFLLAGGVALVPWLGPGAGARVAGVIGGAGFAATLVLLVDRAAGVIDMDWFAAIAAVFVAALSVLIQLFSVRHLRKDPRQRWFVCWVNFLTAGSLTVVSAPSMIWFAAGWSAVGFSLVMLLNTYPALKQARQGVRRAAVSLGIGDAALWIAVLVVTLQHGGVVRWADLPGVFTDLSGPLQLVTGMLLVIAAVSRSAQFPFHTWLSVTLAAPTPVSAVMHAGVVNGAAFVMIRFSSALSGSALTVWTLFVVGSVTLTIGAAGVLMRPDLKGRLVASTTAQMGFMVMTLGVGAYAAAVFHLIGHGLYKANFFLRSGSQITDLRRHGNYPVKRLGHSGRRVALAGIAATFPGIAIIATTSRLSPHANVSTLVLAGYGCVTGAVLLFDWLQRGDLPMVVSAAAVLIVTTAGSMYALVVHDAGRLLGTGLAMPVWTVPGWVLLVPLVLVTCVSVLPAIPALRVPVLYGLVSGIAQSRLFRIPRVRYESASKSSHSALLQEIA